MFGRECYHCKKWIEDGQEHDCWTFEGADFLQKNAASAEEVRRMLVGMDEVEKEPKKSR